MSDILYCNMFLSYRELTNIIILGLSSQMRCCVNGRFDFYTLCKTEANLFLTNTA